MLGVYLPGDQIAGVLLAAGDYDLRAMVGQRLRDRPADPARRSGDNRDFVGEIELVGHAKSAGACLENSIRAIARLWTSSGPSARRSVRIPAQLLASSKSCETPAPPWAWTASSMILSAMFGA